MSVLRTVLYTQQTLGKCELLMLIAYHTLRGRDFTVEETGSKRSDKFAKITYLAYK